MVRLREMTTLPVALAVLACATTAQAQAYPDKPVHLVVAFPPGGGADTVSRLIGQKLAVELGQPVIIENRPGAGGAIGSDFVGKAAADGYTLLVGPASHVIAPNFFKVNVDPVRGFTPITQMISASIVLAASGKRPETSLEAFVANVRETPALGTIASAGVGTVFHLSGARLAGELGVGLQHVAYRGGGPAVIDLVAGQVPIMIDTYFTFRPFIESGKVKPWATLGQGRSPLLPDVPTMVELGYPEVVADNWYGLFAPAGTPEPIVRLLADKTRTVLQQPDTIAKLAEQGAVPVASSPQDFADFVQNESRRWAELVRTHQIKAE
ncbi:Bug family tripartite tricarboxylate transporter substrate binding protein [Bordetella trematum]|uniref:Bug family tripartite tricarboxylate transporter substrate binding protein n=1 Tax=Bordetella trematum TaxID=123899 RepID=UPI000D81D146|nr:tripartite tricarboxylate transporter substrate binding protein [Bordetella trematum]SPU51277.1 putattive exported protein [Bordetella trematum]VDH05620.1 Argininosuccinate lyase [Bordetella trematum]